MDAVFDDSTPAERHHHPHISSFLTPSSEREPLCYFTYIPSAPSDHWSIETPLPSPGLTEHIITPDPHNPLLAARPPILSLPPQTMDASKLLQLQTAAAHPQRPKPRPHQDVLELSDDSASSSASSESGASSASLSSSSSSRPRICSRCQTTFGEFVAFSINAYYCTRCAKITGLIGG
ncbi:uncharacterized protein PV09_06051 [Verruconis gallopava]|uniref:Uncharacterized protein n=1 Tax=Verruconis gallopava TaxID=253628 RepID=A0A0D1YPQ6_9PEZI|nr:uncharacterized protein PV09_06051 [Verruconis gallopava]KIW02602.1 hypothetical protein PV09_06051 [Verruconis gallopava]